MGRIRTQLIKRTTNKLVKEHPDQFSGDFNANKEAVNKFIRVGSTKLRNAIAGYITKIIKIKKASGE
jgi:small subunit ribosomal protein S17e